MYKWSLTIILPVYNRENYIEKTLDSIIDQSFKDFYLIIIDDCSKDRSLSIIKNKIRHLENVLLLINDTNLGKSKSINNVIPLLNSKYVSIHDSDDVSDPTRFQTQIDALEKDDDLVMCGTSYATIDKFNRIKNKYFIETDYDKIKASDPNTLRFHGPTIVFRSSVLPKLNNIIFREYFDNFNEDFDLVLRLVSIGKSINLASLLYYYRIHENSLSKQLSPQKIISKDICLTLYSQRLMNAKDDLECNITRLKKLEISLLKKYNDDPHLFNLQNISFLFEHGFYKKTFYILSVLIIKHPLYFTYWKTFFYCVKNIFTFSNKKASSLNKDNSYENRDI